MRSHVQLGKVLLLGALATLFGAANAAAQAKPLAGADVPKIYERLLKQIDQIPIYDNHSHATFPDDSDMDAQAAPPDESSVLRLSDDQSRNLWPRPNRSSATPTMISNPNMPSG